MKLTTQKENNIRCDLMIQQIYMRTIIGYSVFSLWYPINTPLFKKKRTKEKRKDITATRAKLYKTEIMFWLILFDKLRKVLFERSIKAASHISSQLSTDKASH